MPIAVQTNRSEQVLQLSARDSHLTPADIAATTGLKLRVVKAALSHGRCDNPKSRVT